VLISHDLERLVMGNVFCIGEILPKKLIWKIWFLPMQRIFHGKNGTNFPDFEEKNSKLPDFYDKFHYVAKIIKGFCFFSTFISSM
jgi:hypothetical protein